MFDADNELNSDEIRTRDPETCKLERLAYRFRNSLRQEVGVVEDQLEEGGQQDGEAEHDDVAVDAPAPGRQVDAVIELIADRMADVAGVVGFSVGHRATNGVNDQDEKQERHSDHILRHHLQRHHCC